MFVFLLQLRHSLQTGRHLYLFTLFVALVWTLWVAKVALSRRYRPWSTPYLTTTSVVIPVVDEPIALFRDVLRRIVEQRPDETIVVINGPRNLQLEAVCAEFGDEVSWLWTPVAGKRHAVQLGTERARGDVVVLVDSDTIWTPGTLSELLKPFADPRVGGVTTKQRILDHTAACSPAGPTGWKTRGRCTRCPRRACSGRSAACPAARSRSGGTSCCGSCRTSCASGSSACSSRLATTGR